jgi:hypothetical protein
MKLLAMAVVSVVAVPALGQVPTVLFSEGDPIGPGNDPVTQILNPAANNVGGFLIRPRFGDLSSTSPLATTDFLYGKLTGAGTAGVLRSEGVLGSENLLSIGSWTLTDNGKIGFTATLTPTVPRLQGAYIDDALIAKSGSAFPSGLGYDGQFWGRTVGISGLNDAGDAFMRATVNASSALPSGETKAVLLHRTAGGVFTKLLETGQSLGLAGTISANETSAVGGATTSNNGLQWATTVDTNPAPTNVTNLIVKNGLAYMSASGALVRTGDPVLEADGGQAGEVFASIGNLSLNDSGSFAFNAGFNGGDEAQDETIWVDGTVRYREGQTVDGKTLTGLINNLHLNNQGDLLYSYDQTGLFLNDSFIVGTGTLVDTDGNGSADTALASFTQTLGTALTDRDANGDVSVYFIGRTSGTQDRLFKVDFNLGGGGGGTKWLTDGGGNWEDAVNWQGGVPDAAGAAANFVTGLTAPAVVILATSKTVGSVKFDSANSYTIQGAGLTLDNNWTAAAIELVSGSHVISSTVTAMGDLNVSLGAGQQLSLGGSVSVAGELNIAGGGLMMVEKLDATSLRVSNGRLMFIGGGEANLTTLLAVDDGSTLEFGVDSLVVDYAGVSPIGGVIEMYLAGKLTANGDDGFGLPTYLAIAEAADLGATELNGRPVDDTAVLVKFTYVGDANLDGQVDSLDYERVDLAIGNSGVFGVAQGDLNYDGNVDALDYEQIDLNIGNGVGAPLAAVFVPEPGVAGAVVLAGLMAVRRRR